MMKSVFIQSYIYSQLFHQYQQNNNHLSPEIIDHEKTQH